MAAGQGPLSATLDVAVLQAAEQALEAERVTRGQSHGRRLRTYLRVHAAFTAAGMGLSTTAHLALVEQVSEHSAAFLLEQARLLVSLDGALDAVETGLLSVEQAGVLTRQLAPLSPELQAAAWACALAELHAAQTSGTVLSPARLADLLRKRIIALDPDDAITRRRKAEAGGDVDYRHRDDGLVDLFALGITGPNARAILSRIRDRARRSSSQDPRSAGERRRDAFVDLMLGRDQLPLDDGTDPRESDPWAQPVVAHCGPRCGCRLGEVVPCGASITVLVPLGAALGTTDELADLAGHGPLEPDLLQALLHNAPVLTPVFIDDTGAPVALGNTVERPPARDPDAVRQALLRLADSRPSEPPVPRHPDDHPPRPPGPDVGTRLPDPATPGRHGQTGENDGEAACFGLNALTLRATSLSAAALRGPDVPIHPHPAGTPGRYRPPSRLARLIRVRAPRCEWPGCGAGSASCDLDHDLAHPHGPTCGCNLGPLCRRHHRLKQQLMTKLRRPGHVLWTGPTGRTWTSPSQHHPPQPPVRPLPPVPDRHAPDDDDENENDGDGIDAAHSPDPMLATPPAPDRDPFEQVDLRGWGLALDDHTRWT